MNFLRRKKDYDPLFLTNKEMSLDKYGVICGQSCLSGSTRRTFRARFKDETKKGAKGICFHVFGRMIDGTNPDCIFVWKVPSIHPQDHAGQIARAINECRKQVLKYLGQEMAVHFDRIIIGISILNPKVKKVLRSYIFFQGRVLLLMMTTQTRM